MTPPRHSGRPWDPQGENEYPAEACQRVVAEFEGIIEKLWEGFRDIREAKSRRHIFDGLDPFLARAFGDCVLFTAEALPKQQGADQHQRYKILSWNCTVPKTAPDMAETPAWANDFESRFLDQVLDSPRTSVFPPQDMMQDGGPLGSTLPNLAVGPIWFAGKSALYLGVSLLKKTGGRDVWEGWRTKIVEMFPELLATPLRVENHHSQLKEFQAACRGGLAAEVTRRGEAVMSSRVQLAWRASAALATYDNQPPAVSGDYDALVANYLDALRFVKATAAAEPGDKELEDAAKVFGRLFSPSDKDGGARLVLHANTHSDAEKESFVVAEDAVLARHAIGRSLVWLAYRSGGLSRKVGEGWECPFPQPHLAKDDVKHGVADHKCCYSVLCGDYGKTSLPPDSVIDPDSVHVSWLRYLWVDIFYRARDIRENRGEKSEHLLTELAKSYRQAVKATRKAFPEMLAARQQKDDELRVDWRWLYLWFLGNAMNSGKIDTEYGCYQQDKHGFRSHLDHYRDVSTAVLFGLHLFRFWDEAITLELWDLPEVRPDEVMQARLRLLCEYAYVEIGVDRAWQLEHHLGAQFQPEMILQATSPAHRQHALHVMDVCLLGHLLLCSYTAFGMPSRFQRKILGRKPVKQFLGMWYAAALLHDVGRAEEVAHIVPGLLKSLGTPDVKKYSEAVEKGIDEANAAFDEAITAQFKSLRLGVTKPVGGFSRDHGVVSANHLIHSVKGTAGDESFLRKEDTKTVLRAIAKHNLHESFGAPAEPLSYLLVLNDHLQEWSRPRFAAQQLAMSFLGATQISTPFTAKGERSAHWLAPDARYDKERNAIVDCKESIQLK